MIRTACLKHDVVFPVRNDIDKYKSLFHPPISSCQLKSYVDVTSLLQETASSLMKMNSGHEVSGSYHLVGKFGVDRSGSHKVRQQLIDVELARSETSHLGPISC